jgi:hypothetical protein
MSRKSVNVQRCQKCYILGKNLPNVQKLSRNTRADSRAGLEQFWSRLEIRNDSGAVMELQKWALFKN